MEGLTVKNSIEECLLTRRLEEREEVGREGRRGTRTHEGQRNRIRMRITATWKKSRGQTGRGEDSESLPSHRGSGPLSLSTVYSSPGPGPVSRCVSPSLSASVPSFVCPCPFVCLPSFRSFVCACPFVCLPSNPLPPKSSRAKGIRVGTASCSIEGKEQSWKGVLNPQCPRYADCEDSGTLYKTHVCVSA